MEPAYIGFIFCLAKPKRIDYRVKAVQKTPESANTKFDSNVSQNRKPTTLSPSASKARNGPVL